MNRNQEIVERIESLLPPHIFIFDVSGQKSFPVYGITGGITTQTVSYLVKRGEAPYPALFDGGCLPLKGTIQLERGWAVSAMRISKLVEEGDISEEAIRELVAPSIKELGEN